MEKDKLIILMAVVIAFLVGLDIGLFAGPQLLFSIYRSQLPAPGGSFGSTNSTKTTGTLFSNFQYASSSYMISGNATLSASGKIATDDFKITTVSLQNGSTQYSLKFDELGTVYNITIGKNEKLYYIDTNLADDMSGADTSFGDDGYAVVNSTGYVVSYKYPLPRT